MRVATSSISNSVIDQIQALNAQQTKLQNDISSGRRISQPSDDPAAVERVLNLQSEQRTIEQFQSNASRALELSQASYSGLQSLKSVSDRAGQLVALGSTDVNASSMSGYATELNQLIEHTLDVLNTSYGGNFIYGGTATDTAPFVAQRDASGQIASVSYVGNNASQSIALSATSSVQPGTTGTANAALGNYLTKLISLRDALASGSTTTVAALQPDISSGEDTVITAMADAGGTQARIQAAQTQQQDRLTSIASLISGEADTDVPSTMVKLSQTQTAYEAALSSAAKIMKLSLLDYLN